MQLRTWQKRCVNEALRCYDFQSHFMCLATPGAGKTVMAATLAARLMDLKKIDFILCFSPSIEVNENIKITFTKIFNRRFDGLLGALGGIYTYQSMSSFSSEFWQLLKSSKVLIILDEVHHLKGSELCNANAWGEEVLLNIQNQAEYTLALSGTPWRSDQAPIVLSRFTEPDNTIHCDFVYGLQEAVANGVCRKPNIVLIDNDKIELGTTKGSKVFNSIAELLTQTKFSYQSLINNTQIVHYILRQCVQKLDELRYENPRAGGLVVASSIQHAMELYRILKSDFKQSACIVTSNLKNTSTIIDTYRNNTTQWIVSVGMISEGTDVPRLQVCCHLSRIRTEMHYRQVLGRILRISDNAKQAWLFTLAESALIDFANRIGHDLPDYPVVFAQNENQKLNIELSNTECDIDVIEETNVLSLSENKSLSILKHAQKLTDLEEENQFNLALLGGYKEKLINMII
ncbi:DEAD/DEAH box helicase [Shewanella frigidimarina]|uniref:DEAD/DEAH box helicase n=1 Tax=Shewanella frigidimarina TaxID=56812 RepID=UPI003D795E05